MQSDRPKLAIKEGVRSKYNATVERFGTKSSFGHLTPTILLRNIKDENKEIITDHVWFTQGKWCKELKPGDNFNFEARVKPYEKGYRGHREEILIERGYGTEISHRLSNPTKIEIISRKEEEIA
jgi:hypothetical protein